MIEDQIKQFMADTEGKQFKEDAVLAYKALNEQIKTYSKENNLADIAYITGIRAVVVKGLVASLPDATEAVCKADESGVVAKMFATKINADLEDIRNAITEAIKINNRYYL